MLFLRITFVDKKNNKQLNTNTMKTRLFFAALLLLAFGTVKAQNEADQINIIRVLGSGDVVVSQTPGQLSLKKDGKIVTDYNRTSDMLILSGSDDYEVAISQLKNVQLLSSADVVCKSPIMGDYINVYSSGSGDMVMKLDYDTVHVVLNGSGDIILEGRYQCDNHNLKLEGGDGYQLALTAQVLSFTDDTMRLQFVGDDGRLTVTLVLRKTTD